MKIIQKAYNVWHDGMIGYGPEIYNSIEDTEVVYADTPGEAKSKAGFWMDWEIDGRDAKFIDLKCRRAKNYDIVNFEGENIKGYQIQHRIRRRESDLKLDAILNNPHIKYCYIHKGGMFYRSNYCGYTDFRHRAGIYLKEDAVSHARGVIEIYLERIDIEEHNKMIKEEIRELEDKIIRYEK